MRHDAKEVSPTEDIGLARTTMRLMAALLTEDFGAPLSIAAMAAADKAEKAAADKVANNAAAVLAAVSSVVAGALDSTDGAEAKAADKAAVSDGFGAEAQEVAPGASYDDTTKTVLVESVFLFALVWSLGCTGDGESRRKFDAFLRSMMSGVIPDGYAVSGGWRAAWGLGPRLGPGRTLYRTLQGLQTRGWIAATC